MLEGESLLNDPSSLVLYRFAIGESSFAFPLTQEHLADALGLTVHVDRMMQQLRAEGLIATANRTVTLPDVAGLRSIAEFDPRYLHRDPTAALQLS